MPSFPISHLIKHHFIQSCSGESIYSTWITNSQSHFAIFRSGFHQQGPVTAAPSLLTTQRNFGMGRRFAHQQITIPVLSPHTCLFMVHPLDPAVHLSYVSFSVIYSTVFGNSFEYEDKEFITLLGLIEETTVVLFSPWVQIVVEGTTQEKGCPASHDLLGPKKSSSSFCILSCLSQCFFFKYKGGKKRPKERFVRP
uniref:Uncharacterized protein n=1 Tax=Sphaerodactylus townsendi TaxID=933632 RepID=A0ACB8FT18_9SAUR